MTEKNYLKDSLLYYPAKMIPAVCSFASLFVFTRLVSPNVYGEFALLFAGMTILATVLGQWIDQGILRYIPSLESEAGELFGKIMFLGIALQVFEIGIAFILFFSSPVFRANSIIYWMAFIFMSEMQLYNLFRSYYQSLLQPKKIVCIESLLAIFKFLLAVALLILLGPRSVHILFGYALSYILVIAYIFHDFQDQNIWRFDTTDFQLLLKDLFTYGLPLVGWVIGSQLFNLSDRYILDLFHGKEQVGIYSASYDFLHKTILLVGSPLVMAAHPIIMKSSVKFRTNELQNFISSISRYYIILALPILFFLSLLNDVIVNMVFNNDYQAARRIFPYVAAGLFIWHFSMFGHKPYEIKKQTSKLLLYAAAAASSNIILNFVFIPNYGYIAAAITTLFCSSIYAFLVYRGSKNLFKWKIPYKTLRSAIISIFPCAIITFWLKAELMQKFNDVIVLLFFIVLWASLYSLTMFSLISKEDRKSIMSVAAVIKKGKLFRIGKIL